MKNVVAKDLRTPKYKMRVEPSQKHFVRDSAKVDSEIADLLDDINELSDYEIQVLKEI